MTIQERVNNGIKWLNENHPGWESKIDLDTFVFDDVDKCILGQLNIPFYNQDNEILEERGFDPYYEVIGEEKVLVRSLEIEKVWREYLTKV